MIAKKLDILTAVEQGYRIVLHGDGVADVVQPDGKQHGVDLFSGEYGVCTCADFQTGNGLHQAACKHMWWVGQLTVCPHCKKVMVLTDWIFECTNQACNAARSLGLVKEQRAERRAAQARSVA